MFSHVHIRVADLAGSTLFYETVLAPLGIAKTWDDGRLVEFELLALSADGPVSQNVHLAFVAASREEVEVFHRAGVGTGYRDHGAPRYRPQYAPDHFAAYVLDPDGNNVEAVWRDPSR